ncbi:VWFA-related domain-containing protein [Granulicella rosea]|uniref:VWFA-related domain-containing protein n=1 Tax=Granulicella rosea TaxID=474952 RepID=A0A239D073_9BACT|nr:VWA domain-containing protein [Granulicella rosea]SNS25418.1 VWFA-related domain-containing protein [Granulicella rosea]
MRLFLLALFLVPCALHAQDDATPFTLRSQTSVVLVPAQVQTKKGEVIYGLKPEQFLLTDNGVAQKIRVDEDVDAQGLSLVVVVQCSRAAIMEAQKTRGLGEMIDDLTGGAPHEVALVSYGSEPELLTNFTSRPQKLADAIGQLQPCEDDGGAAHLDAVAFANKLLERRDEQIALDPRIKRYRHAIVLIGETRDHGSKAKPADVIAALGRSNTVLDAVAFSPGKTEILNDLHYGGGSGPMGLLVMAVNALKKNVPHTLASLSGGEYTNFTTQNGFDAGLHRLSNHIHNYYLLSFQPAASNTPGMHHLELKIPDYPDAQIRSRMSYYAGDAPAPDVAGK